MSATTPIRCDIDSVEGTIVSRISYLYVEKRRSNGSFEVRNLDQATWSIGKDIVANECLGTHVTDSKVVSTTDIVNDVIKKSNGGILKLEFTKQDGSLREMVCSYKQDDGIFGRAEVYEYVVGGDGTFKHQKRLVDYRTLESVVSGGTLYKSSRFYKQNGQLKKKRSVAAASSGSSSASSASSGASETSSSADDSPTAQDAPSRGTKRRRATRRRTNRTQPENPETD